LPSSGGVAACTLSCDEYESRQGEGRTPPINGVATGAKLVEGGANKQVSTGATALVLAEADLFLQEG